ncbi:MAG TPA: SIS domain-containing protein [Actinospica sp.]|jgi:glucosamine--fructose-6-phosphate aminotransferase (isomerizing)|nr:SIS domain-containing protein [Actinospica sp.]
MASPTIAMSAAETRRILACRHVRGEMHEQPAVLGRLSRHVEHFARQTGALAAARGGFRDVVFLAPARTQPVAILGRHAVVVRCGPKAVPPDPDAGSRLVVALSPSGEDERVLELSRRAAASGSAVVAVTNDARSPLADAATLTVDLAAGLELSAMPTKTVTGMMLAVLALVDGLPAASDAPSSIADCAHALALAAAVADVLADQDSADAAAARLVAARRIAVLGQGHHHPAALETARMLRETAGLLVEGFSVEEFCSGPLGGFDAETAVVLLAGPGHTDVGPLRDQLHSRGAQVVVIGDTAVAAARPDLPLPGLRVSGAAECVLATVRGQQLAVAAARALGVDPDRPAVS